MLADEGLVLSDLTVLPGGKTPPPKTHKHNTSKRQIRPSGKQIPTQARQRFQNISEAL